MRKSAVVNVANPPQRAVDVRDRILETASALFYRRGVRAVGVDLVVEEAGVAKTSLYRHFRTKDDLIAAFLHREDEDFWKCWDNTTQRHHSDPTAELEAELAERVIRATSAAQQDVLGGASRDDTAIATGALKRISAAMSGSKAGKKRSAAHPR